MKFIKELKTKWQIRFRDTGRKPQEVTFSFDKALFTKRQIEAERDRLRYLWQTGAWDPWSGRLPGQKEEQPHLTIQRAVDEYCKHKRELGVKRLRGGWGKRTERTRRSDFEAFARSVGVTRRVDDLTTRDLEGWIFAAPAEDTQAGRRRILNAFMKWLGEQGYQTPDLPRPFITRRRIPPYLTEEDLEKVCAKHEEILRRETLKKHVATSGRSSPMARMWMIAAFRLAFYQGLRLEEVMNIKVGGIDLERNRMVIGDQAFVPKGKDEAVITITPPAREILRPLVEGRAPDERVFGRKRAKKLSRAFKAALVEALPHKSKASFKTLRLSASIYWQERGVPARDVKNLLRHKSILTTERHYDLVVVDGQTDRFERAFKANGGNEKAMPDA